jgi:hypothetical protein
MVLRTKDSMKVMTFGNKEDTTMKKNIKTLAALLIASATFVACSSDNDSIIDNQQPVNPTGKYTMTIQASKGDGATTRALNLTDHTLNATWSEGEIVEVYQGGSKIGELTAAASTDASTTLTGTFDAAPSTSADLTFYFHTNTTSYSGQDGTLATIASSYDFCAPATVATGDFTVNSANHTISVPAGISFGANQQAIIKFTLKDKGNSDAAISPTALTVTDGTSTVELTSIPADTYTANGADNVLYVAFPAAGSAKTVTLTATVVDDTYTYEKSGVTFTNGQYYEITVKMTQAPALNLTSPAVGQVIGNDGKNYNYASLPSGVTAVAKICYVSGSSGLALALADEGQMNWFTAISTCAAHTPAFTGGTWKLATQDEWNNMITAAGGYTALRDGFSSVGGSNLQSGSYWSSTEKETYYAWSYNFVLGEWGSEGEHKYYEAVRVRACLAWTQAAAAPAAKAAAEATAEDKGKLICTEGHIHAYNADAECTATRVAKIIYIGTTGDDTYSHGLALALNDEAEASTMAWQAAIDACSAKNTSTPVTDATWLLASKDQWDYMLGTNGAGSYTALRDGFSGISGASSLQTSFPYWSSTEMSSTENEYDPNHAWYYYFGDGNWYHGEKGHDSFWVRACLAF